MSIRPKVLELVELVKQAKFLEAIERFYAADGAASGARCICRMADGDSAVSEGAHECAGVTVPASPCLPSRRMRGIG